MRRIIDFEDGLGCAFRPQPAARRLRADLSRGRDGLRLIAGELARRGGKAEILIPALSCDVVFRTLAEQGLAPVFYDVTPSLAVDPADVRRRLTPRTAAILFINYYGFLQPIEAIRELHGLGLPLIEDNTQSFLSGSVLESLAGAPGWSFNSLRKLLPVPDGASVTSFGMPDVPRSPLGRPAGRFVASRLLGLAMKRTALALPLHYTNAATQELFTASVRTMGFPAPAGISALSRLILPFIDVSTIRERRRRNFGTLRDALGGTDAARPPFAALDERCCPFAMPLLCRGRDALQARLASHGVSAPVLWERNPFAPAGQCPVSEGISDRILLLPVGAAYGEKDMKRIADVVLDALAEDRR